MPPCTKLFSQPSKWYKNRRRGRAWWRGGDGGRRPGRGPVDAECQRVSHFCGAVARARAAQAASRAHAAGRDGALGGRLIARALVRFTVSGERRSWARLVALIFREPSRALAARERARRALGECWRVWRSCRAVFSHVCRSRGRHSAAARPGKIPKNRPACALQLCTVWRGRPVVCAGRASS